MNPREYLRIVRRRWVIVAVSTVLAVGVVGLTKPNPKANTVTSYDATTVLLQTRALTQEQSQSRPGAVGYLETIATLVTIGEIPERAHRALEYDGTPQELAARIRTDSDSATGILTITATARVGEQAVEISKVFASETTSYLKEREAELARETIKGLDIRIRDLNGQIAELSGEGASNSRREAKILQLEQLIAQKDQLLAPQPSPLSVVEEPYAKPSREIAYSLGVPSGYLRMVIAGFFGLALGIGIVLLAERLNTRIRTREEAEHHFSAPVLAEIPVLPKSYRGAVVSAERPLSPAADAFGLLAVALARREIGRTDDASLVDTSEPILVTSASHGEGKTTVAVNLAASLAEMGKRVLLISCDYRSATMHAAFDVPGAPGLSDALRDSKPGTSTLASVIRETSIPGLRIVTSGSTPERLSQMLSSEAMRRAMREARLRADFVVVDSAPILAARDAAYLLNEIGSVLVVAGAGKVSADLADRASELFAQVDAPVAGIVLNGSLDAPVNQAAGRSARRRFRIRRGPQAAAIVQVDRSDPSDEQLRPERTTEDRGTDRAGAPTAGRRDAPLPDDDVRVFPG